MRDLVSREKGSESHGSWKVERKDQVLRKEGKLSEEAIGRMGIGRLKKEELGEEIKEKEIGRKVKKNENERKKDRKSRTKEKGEKLMNGKNKRIENGEGERKR